MAKPPKAPLVVETFKHDADTRRNIPTAEAQPLVDDAVKSPVRVAYERRNRDLDPQLVWRGKDQQDWSDLVVHAPPLYIQDKVHPKALIDDLKRQTQAGTTSKAGDVADLFADFNGLPSADAKTEFYQHDGHWANRMILGDSLQVMASLAEREGLRGKVQCIYFDPPYGIKFNSNFQWSTTSRDVKDGNAEHITREPEQVKAFRDTWRDGIHSYLTYLRDRLTVARDLLTESGSIFVQIGDENVHRVRAVMDEVFGEDKFLSAIVVRKTTSSTSSDLSSVYDTIVWYGSGKGTKFRRLFRSKDGQSGASAYRDSSEGSFTTSGLTSQNPGSRYPIRYMGRVFNAEPGWWKTGEGNMARVLRADRLVTTKNSVRYKRYLKDFEVFAIDNLWEDTAGDTDKVYVVQTASEIIKRCLLMATDAGDLVLDPTCGSGTTAFVAEQWGRRWITIDTSRVALALARARIMGARYPYYLLADSRDGQQKEAEVTRTVPSSQPVRGDLRRGFVYERVPHITLKSIANNAEIDVIWDKFQQRLEPLREALNAALGQQWQEWEIPRESGDPWDRDRTALFHELRAIQTSGSSDAKIGSLLAAINHNRKRQFTLDTLPQRPVNPWPANVEKLHADWWRERIARQKEIDASIAAKAEFEFLYDKPYEDKRKVRVAGPFTVESLSPHRTLGVDENDDLIDPAEVGIAEPGAEYGQPRDFATIILEQLRIAGVQQAHKEDRITFTSLVPWPGTLVCAEGQYGEGDATRRAAIFIGPEFGTVSRADLVEAAREAADAGFDVLIACAFNFDAHSTEFAKLGKVPVLKARMNADLHMAEDLKNTGKGNLFVIFGEPDIDVLPVDGGQIKVKVNGVDVFHPNTGEVRSGGADGIACWFIDTDYNQESFFVRHAYFLGANDPYKSLKITLKAEINEDAWASLNSDASRPFPKPASGRIAVKVINHLGDEVMKVFRVS